MTTEEVCLPRGGVQRSAAPAPKPEPKDVLFGVGASTAQKKRRRKHRKRTKGGPDDEPEEEEELLLEPLNAHTLTEGIVLLGCVQLVHDFGLKVSLPFGTVGNVSLRDISRVYFDLLRRFAHGESGADDTAIARVNALFREGQCVVCKVVAVSPERAGSARVALTLDPARVYSDLSPSTVCPGMVLQAVVSSVEDHGYAMDCGVAGMEGFLSEAECCDYLRKCNEGRPLAVGQPLLCTVVSAGGRAVQLSVRPKFIESPRKLEEPSLDYMLPGMRAKLTVTQVQDEGLCVTWENFEGCVYKSHLVETWDLPRDYAHGQEVMGTLLYIDPGSRHPYWCLKPLGRWEPPKELSVGALIKDARVVGVDSWGAHLELTRGKLRAYAPRAHVAEGEVDDVRDALLPGQTYRCRIMAFNFVDCVAVVSLKKSCLEGVHITPDMLNLGMKLVGKVYRVLPSGALISLGPWMRGFVSRLHLQDWQLQVGQPVRCRLLNVELHRDPPRLWFTCHRGLIASRRPPLTRYVDAVPGLVCDGLVVQVVPQGILVIFYGNVRGWVPTREILRCPVPLVQRYKVGQLVTCRVVLCELEKERLTLSFKLKAKDETDEDEQEKVAEADHVELEAPEVGAIVSGKVLEKKGKYLVVELSDGNLAHLPRMHVSHSAVHRHHLWESFSKGDVLDSLVCYGVQNRITVSRRASFVHLAKKELLVTSLEDMMGCPLVYGLVKHFTKGSMHVSLPGMIRGIVPFRMMRNFYVSGALESGFVVGQLVAARCVEVKGQRCILSTMPADVANADDEARLHEAAAWLQDQSRLWKLGLKWSRSKSVPPPPLYSVVEVNVEKVERRFVKCTASGFPAVALCRNLKQSKTKTLQQTEGLVVDVRLTPGVLEVCLDPHVIAKVKEAKNKQLKMNQKYCCTVVLAKRDHVLVQLPQGHLCVVSTSPPLGPSSEPVSLREDASVTVWVWKMQGEVAIGSYILPGARKAGRKKTTRTPLPVEMVGAGHGMEKIEDTRGDEKGTKRKQTTVKLEERELENRREKVAEAGARNKKKMKIEQQQQLRANGDEADDKAGAESKEKKIKTEQKRKGMKIAELNEELKKSEAQVETKTTKNRVKKEDDESHPKADATEGPADVSEAADASNGDADEAEVNSTAVEIGSDLASDLDDDEDHDCKRDGTANVDSYDARKDKVRAENADVAAEIVPEEVLDPQALRPGGVCSATVTAVDKFQLRVRLPGKLSTRVHATLIKKDPEEGTKPLSGFKVGDKVVVHMTQLKTPRGPHHLEITSREAEVPYECSLFETSGKLDLHLGKKITGIYSHLSDGCLHLFISPNKMATLPVLNLKLHVEKLPYLSRYFRPGQAVGGTIFRVYDDGVVELSQLDTDALQVGQVVNARVLSVRATVGAFLSLPLGCRGVAGMTDFRDDFSETASFVESITETRYTACCVLGIEEETGICHVSMRASRLGDDHPVVDREITSLKELRSGDRIRGFVRSVNKRGCFVTVGYNISCLVPRGALRPSLLQHRGLKSDELVTVEVHSVDHNLEMVKLALYETHENPREERRKTSETAEADLPSRKRRSSETKVRPEERVRSTEDQNLPRLTLSEDFVWDVMAKPDLNGLAARETKEEDSDAEDEKPVRKKSRKEILEERQRKEAELCERERALMDPSREPVTVDDFDRLVLASPNSSMVWLRYMAFHLQQAEVEKARAVGHRALSVISFREEQEKLNVWTALLNLENLYGTQESLQTVFDEALRYNEPLKVYTHLVQIYIASDKHEQAEQLYKQMLAKFKQSTEVWIGCGLYYMQTGKAEEARGVMERALRSLPRQEHVGLLSKFAQMEFKYGSAERGKSMFDSILLNCPKRTDLWLVYIDQEIKHGDHNGVRTLFIRVTSMRFHPKKMKIFFKKWLDFEKEHGDAKSVQEVRERAVKYVEAHTADIG